MRSSVFFKSSSEGEGSFRLQFAFKSVKDQPMKLCKKIR